jgi:hypothetical protein
MREPVKREDIEKAISRLEEIKKHYLEEHGWKYTCQTPGSVWLWKKIHMDDTYMCNTPMALCIEEALSPE